MLRIPFAVLTLVILAVVAASTAPTASARTTCAGGVVTGVTISGGLTVTGDCIYNDSTISGGITVTGTGGLELENSYVSGGITVQPGGELDAGHVLNSPTATGNPNTISGGINFNGVDIDLFNATVTGGTRITGQGANYVPQICGSSLASLVVRNVSGTFTAVHIGDPGEPFEGGTPTDCPGNTFSGSITLEDSNNVEIESNFVGGSISISDSTLIEVAGNTVQGSIHCDNVTSATDGDHTPNTVGGSNDCP
jgi:hypothetical protein